MVMTYNVDNNTLLLHPEKKEHFSRQFYLKEPKINLMFQFSSF